MIGGMDGWDCERGVSSVHEMFERGRLLNRRRAAMYIRGLHLFLAECLCCPYVRLKLGDLPEARVYIFSRSSRPTYHDAMLILTRP